jgi:hypothetical protein
VRQDCHDGLPQRTAPSLSVKFLGRSIIGLCKIHIADLKLGRQFSTVRVRLLQETGLYLEALVIHGNLAAEARGGGMTLPTLPVMEKSKMLKLEILSRE